MEEPEKLYGLLAEFDEPAPLLAAARRARAAGYRAMDACTPFPVEGLSEAVGFKGTRLQGLVLAAGLLGAVGAFAMQYFSSAHHYPVNIGGRPLNSWPAFFPIIFELTVLCASLTALVAMVGLNGLPKPYHPLFNNPNFDRASSDRFFLCIMAADPQFELGATRRFLEEQNPISVSEVPLGAGED